MPAASVDELGGRHDCVIVTIEIGQADDTTEQRVGMRRQQRQGLVEGGNAFAQSSQL